MKQISLYLKTALLILLIGTSVVQTTTLWFDEMSDRNVFYRAVNHLSSLADQKETASMIRSGELAVYFGGGQREYTVIREEAVAVDRLMEAIRKLMAEGIPQAQRLPSPQEPSVLWEKPYVAMALSAPLETLHFAKSLAIRHADVGFEGRVSSVAVQPASLEEERLSLLLLDENSGLYYRFSLDKNAMGEANSLVLQFIEDKAASETTPPYISTLKEGLALFADNALLPLPTGMLTYYDTIYLYTPYVEDGRILTGVEEAETSLKLEGHVGRFFNNPDIKTVTRKMDSVVYGDGEVSVSYNEAGLLEMKRVVTGREMPDIFEAFALADGLVKREMQESMLDYVYEGYEAADDSVVFRYSYRVDGYPVHLDEAVMSQSGLEWPIEVEVTGETVAGYKRLVVQREETLIQPTAFAGRYQDALDAALVAADSPAGAVVGGMELAYLESAPGVLAMQWRIRLDGQELFQPVGQGGEGQ